MRKILLLLCVLSLFSAPAYSDEFAALERGLTAGRIIRSVSDNAYLAGNDQTITEATIAELESSDYGKTGLTADGNTRLILRYQSDTEGSVAFSVSPSIPGSKLERLTDRAEITEPVSTVNAGGVNQVSAVFIAPETWPSTITYPKGEFTVTARFTPSNGSASTESTLTLTLQAPPVVLIHGAFGTNERAFGYTQGTRHGVWQKLEDAGLTVVSWNYPNEKSPKELIANNNNGLAKTLADTFDKLNSQGIAATRADLVTHSSGGLIARQYLRDDIDTGNETANSYGLGTVRRVVTIASPNLGSNVSSYSAGKFSTLPASWQNWQAKSVWEGIIYSLLKHFVFERKNAEQVMEDTSLGSTFIANLGYPDVPFHSIYGKVSADQDKFNQLFEDVKNKNITALRNITWLPEHIVNMLLSTNLEMVSTILTSLDPVMRFRELLGALFGNDDHDLVVSETSAKDVFPANALTSFEGLGTHNHILIAQQDDVGERVAALLKGGTENFAVNTASSTAFNSAFDSLLNDYSSKMREMRAAEDVDFGQYVDQSLAFDVSDPETENLGGVNGDYPVIQSLKLTGSSDKSFDTPVIIGIIGEDGSAKFLTVDVSGDKSFDVELWAGREDKGILNIAYMTVQDGKLKVSSMRTVVFAPLLDGLITSLEFPFGSALYCHVGDETPIGLVAHTKDGNYDVSAPALGIVSWSNSDPSVAEITDEGCIRGLKEGETTISATAQGHTVTVRCVVLSSSSAADTTQDIGSGNSRISGTSSSSGCSAGFSAVMLLSVLAFVTKKR